MKLHSSPNNGESKPVQIGPDDVEFKQCSNCASDAFIEAKKIGVLSPVHPSNPTGKPQVVPFPVVACAVCGKELKLNV
jgi:hypothetical protein